MALAARAATPINNEIKLEYGIGQTFALKYVTAKPVFTKYPGGRAMFTAVDERKLFLNDEETSEFEHALADLGVQVADFIRVTKVRMPHGGGAAIRVERVPDAAEPDEPVSGRLDTPQTRTEALLEKSVEMARSKGPAAFSTPKPAPVSNPVTPRSAAMCAAMCAAVDSVIETQAYAARKGLGLTFGEESVRAIGLSIYSSDCKGGVR